MIHSNAAAKSEGGINIRGMTENSDWENVYVFISSTFNDMHAERDFLVKRVFPELSAWCEERRLRLVDIDLRWGVTEEDSEHNKRVVEVCLQNIDQCRPFFLCFLGQRYGWRPSKEDIADGTFINYPKLKDYLGASVTELEILHALLNPMHKDHKEAAKYAFFFLRDPDYLKEIHYAPLRAIFTNEGEKNAVEKQLSDEKQEELRQRVAKIERPFLRYQASWNPTLATPELLFTKNPDPKMTRGRLCDFRTIEDKPLAAVILEQLKQAIELRFGKRDGAYSSLLQKERAEQGKFLRLAAEGYIARPALNQHLESYINSVETRPLYICAKAGMGKSSFLSNFILEYNAPIIYRFSGISDDSYTAQRLAASILTQLGLSAPSDPKELLLQFPALLAQAAQQQPFLLIVDALDQLTGGVYSADFLPKVLPQGLKLIASFRSDTSESLDYMKQICTYADLFELPSLKEKKEKLDLVHAYLQTYLKELDEPLLDELVGLEGTENPLFLKIILQELRMFGSHDNLSQKIHDAYGAEPATAFSAMLKRVEMDPAYHNLQTYTLANYMFGFLAHARYGLSVDELGELLVQNGHAENKDDAMDAVNHVVRQLRGYLVRRDGRIGFFFDSLRQACSLRYCKGKSAQQWHGILARYFGEMSISHPRRLMELAFHLAHAQQKCEYKTLLAKYEHHKEQLEQFGVDALLEDCGFLSDESIRLLYQFYCLAGATLRTFPDQLPAQLWGRLQENGNDLCDTLIRDASICLQAQKQAWLRPKIPCFERPGESLVTREYKTDEVLGTSLALSPDGKYMVVPSRRNGHDEAFLVWDRTQCMVVHRLELADPVQACFSPDGHYLIGNYQFCGKRLRVWDANSFRVLVDFPDELPYHCTKRGLENYAQDVSFAVTPDSRAIVVWTKPSSVSLLDIHDAQRLCEIPYERAVSVFAFGGNLLAVGNLHPDRDSEDYQNPWMEREPCPIGLFDYDAVQRILTLRNIQLEGHRSSATTLAVSPCGRYVASSGETGDVCIWSTATGLLLREVQADRRRVLTMSFSPKGDRLMIGGSDGALHFYSVPELEPQRRISCHMGPVHDAVYCDSGNACAAVSTLLHTIKLFSLSGPEQMDNSSSELHKSLGKSAKSDLFIASSYTNFIKSNRVPTPGEASGVLSFFDCETNNLVRTAPLLSIDNTDFPVVAMDGNSVVSKNDALENETGVVVCNWPFGEFPALQEEFPCGKSFRVKFRQRRHFSQLNRFTHFSSDCQYVICSIEEQNEFKVYRTQDGQCVAHVAWKPVTVPDALPLGDDAQPYEHEEQMNELLCDLSPDGMLLYTLHLCSGYLSVYKLRKGKGKRLKCIRVKGFRSGRALPMDTIYSNDRMCLSNQNLLVHTDEFVAVIDAKKGRLLFQLDRREEKEGEHWSESNTHAALHPNGGLVFVSRAVHAGSLKRECLEAWDVPGHRRIARFFVEGHISNIIAEASQCSFAAGSGEMFTLFLENVTEKEGESA